VKSVVEGEEREKVYLLCSAGTVDKDLADSVKHSTGRVSLPTQESNRRGPSQSTVATTVESGWVNAAMLTSPALPYMGRTKTDESQK
jgi:hypothetical protein